MIDHHGSDIRGGRFRHWDGACSVAVSVGDNDDGLIIFARLREWSE